MRTKHKQPEIVLRKGKPTAVILDIDVYREMLERLEDLEDIQALQEMRNQPTEFVKLDDFLKELDEGV